MMNLSNSSINLIPDAAWCAFTFKFAGTFIMGVIFGLFIWFAWANIFTHHD
jgi:hypothetical protein